MIMGFLSLPSPLSQDDSNSIPMEPLLQGPIGSLFDSDPNQHSC